MELKIEHDAERGRFKTEVEGLQCELDYRLAGPVMTLTHTGVPAQLGGRGIAAKLVTAAMDAARGAGWKVVPACSYAVAFMDKHPEYDDLRLRQ